jgi:hypothetical protein
MPPQVVQRVAQGGGAKKARAHLCVCVGKCWRVSRRTAM